ncbi:MAG: 2Fe-2S iron-sulfur cluster-binding protein [Nitriliruptoraceae bacterium]
MSLVPPRPPGPRPNVPVLLDGAEVLAYEGETILALARRLGTPIPTLCYLDGLSVHGGCRLCVVEVVGDKRLSLACATPVTAEMEILTDTRELRDHRRRVIELLFAEGNHICATCVASGGCELQDLAATNDVDHIHYALEFPRAEVDASHPKYVLDRERCVLCTRCVRVCDEVEGAHVWDIANRGNTSTLVAELGKPWGEASSCTWCGKCVLVCPTGALSFKGRSTGEMRHDPDLIAFLSRAREQGEWVDRTEVSS